MSLFYSPVKRTLEGPPMLDPIALKSMMESGNGTFADIATHFQISLATVKSFADQHGLKEPTLADPQSHHIRQLVSAEATSSATNWERLLTDDDAGNTINGIDTLTTDGRVNAVDIITFYHGALVCMYSGARTDSVMAVDGNQNNFLISNLMPISEDVVAARFRETPPLLAELDYAFDSPRPIKLRLVFEHRFDKMLGTSVNKLLVDECVDKWVRPYLQHELREILASYGLPATPDTLALWLWQQLSTKALLKGLSTLRLKFESNLGRRTDYEAILTKHAVLFQVRQMMQRQFSRRSIVPASVGPLSPQPQPQQPPAKQQARRLIHP
jgi:hypothetical protein